MKFIFFCIRGVILALGLPCQPRNSGRIQNLVIEKIEGEDEKEKRKVVYIFQFFNPISRLEKIPNLLYHYSHDLMILYIAV